MIYLHLNLRKLLLVWIHLQVAHILVRLVLHVILRLILLLTLLNIVQRFLLLSFSRLILQLLISLSIIVILKKSLLLMGLCVWLSFLRPPGSSSLLLQLSLPLNSIVLIFALFVDPLFFAIVGSNHHDFVDLVNHFLSCLIIACSAKLTSEIRLSSEVIAPARDVVFQMLLPSY